MRVHLINGPLSGYSYKFEGKPTHDEIAFKYNGRAYIYKYVSDMEDGWLYRYEGETLWNTKRL